MPAYRMYRMDGSGKIESATWIAADDDDQAMKLAREEPPSSAQFEIWERDRFVGRS